LIALSAGQHEFLSDSRHYAQPHNGVFFNQQHNHGGCAVEKQNYENKRSERRGTSADDNPGCFPDLLDNRRAESRCHSQRQLCSQGDVCRDDQGEPTRHAKRLERSIKNMTDDPTQADLDNHANQCNPNNDEYWNSRGEGDDD
jgi:hypothetical protein